MDYESIKSNLESHLPQLKAFMAENNGKVAQNFLLGLADAKGCEVIGINDSYYIKNGENPKAILHLNIDVKYEPREIDYTADGKLIAGKTINLLSAVIVIGVLLEESSNDFDVLITNNNIQTDDKNYESLAHIIRAADVINLNLRQAKTLADEFSALILSNVKVPIEREELTYEAKNFNLRLDNLIGGLTGEDLDKLRLNSIKTLINFIRKIKSKVDLDLISFDGGDRYDNIPSNAEVSFAIKEDYVSDLYDVFNLYKNEFISKNLKYEPDMDINLTESEEPAAMDPMTAKSFNHLASFIELIPSGAYAVNSTNGQLISSLNLSTARTFADYLNLIVVYRSLTEEGMNDMMEKAKTAASISGSEVINRLHIPRWKNPDDSLTEVFNESYRALNGGELEVVKTQYSLDSSIIFNELNVKLVSLGVEYKQGEDTNYYANIADIIMVIELIDDVLARIQTH